MLLNYTKSVKVNVFCFYMQYKLINNVKNGDFCKIPSSLFNELTSQLVNEARRESECDGGELLFVVFPFVVALERID